MSAESARLFETAKRAPEEALFFSYSKILVQQLDVELGTRAALGRRALFSQPALQFSLLAHLSGAEEETHHVSSERTDTGFPYRLALQLYQGILIQAESETGSRAHPDSSVGHQAYPGGGNIDGSALAKLIEADLQAHLKFTLVSGCYPPVEKVVSRYIVTVHID